MMGDTKVMARSALQKTVSLLRDLWLYTAPRGNWRVRARIGSAFACLVASKGSNIITPLMYGAAVDLVNGDNGFSMSVLLLVVAGYALSRLGQQIFAEAKKPGTTVRLPHRWSEDETWRDGYARVDESNVEALRKMGEQRRKEQEEAKARGVSLLNQIT